MFDAEPELRSAKYRNTNRARHVWPRLDFANLEQTVRQGTSHSTARDVELDPHQILHGEQGALYGASQVLHAVPWFDGKLIDEARHIEVFHRYLDEKLERRYEINQT
jgi:hypothetical protein